MLNMHKWRRRQVHSYFLPKTAKERSGVKEKVRAMLAAKDVTQRAANASLRELKDTIIATSSADPLEIEDRTRHTIGVDEGHVPSMMATGPLSNMTSTGALPQAAATAPSFPTYTNYEGSTRFTGPPGETAPVGRMEERGTNLANKDIRKVRDTDLRQRSGLN
jgi:hypothetical protein